MGLACCKDQIKNDQESSSKLGSHKILTKSIDSQSQQQSTQSVINSTNLKHSQENQGPKRNGFLPPQTINTTKSDFPKRSPENYQSIKYLGKGIFGDVVLAQDKQTGHQYAMKIIQKKKIKQFNVLQSSIIKIISQNDLFVSIHQTFQNESKIYVVMEYMPRGDIYYYLKKKACVFRQDIIKMIVSEVIVAVQFLHSQEVVYRQLKPQNILVTDDGHIKLGDYGFSRIFAKQKKPISTFIGTLEYTPPQAINGEYDTKADIWAIGILMYELKFEENLFEGTKNQTNSQVETNIKNSNIEDVLNNIVGKVSYDFRDVLIKLLQKDPEKRITINELKKHPFFDGVVWEDIPTRKNAPPLKEILQIDHIKFKDPTNQTQLARRKRIENKDREFKANLYVFKRSESPQS